MTEFDTIGYWSELKLEILEKYAKAYSTILAAKTPLQHVNIDGFSGAGTHVSRQTGALIPGSPRKALEISPPFREFFFVDLDGDKVEALQALAGDRPDVHIFRGDCNRVLLQEVFPQVRYRDYRRGLCLLDPYGLHLDWRLLVEAARLQTIEIFLNFPVMDMNRNVLWRDPDGVTPEQRARMTAFWGDESWRGIAYQPAAQATLFGAPEAEKQPNDVVADAFRTRLREIAGYEYVPAPLPMRNRSRAVVYYLFFACHKPVAGKIVEQIFKKYRDR